MQDLLTPEEICELDTFTLEEKIEDLECLPNPALHSQILRLAKLELIDRLEVEDFGMKLANDEYTIDLDFKLPPIAPSQPPSMVKKKFVPEPLSVQSRTKAVQNWKQTIAQSATGFATVGRPAVNYRFKPKVKKVEHVDPAKNYLKAKKHEPANVKSRKASTKKVETLVSSTPATKALLDQLKNSKQAETIEKVEVKQELSLKEKLKKQVKEMKVIYIQNDVYEELKQVKLPPQNLIEEEERFKKEREEEIQTEIQEQSEREEQEKCPQQSRIIQTASLNLQEKRVSECIIQDLSGVQTIDSKQVYPQQHDKNERKATDYVPQWPRGSALPIHQEVDAEIKQAEQQQSKQQQKPLAPTLDPKNRQVRSQSMKTLTKKPIEQPSIDLQLHIPLQQTKSQFKKQKYTKLGSTVYGTMRPTPYKEAHPYHETISSFNKLFPHSKNILTTLRNVEASLQAHFSKNVDQKSREEDCRRVNEDDATFKVISQSQKAQKHRSLFNIEIDSYVQRGSVMLSRIKDRDSIGGNLFYRVVRTKEEVYDIVNSSFHRTQDWLELPHGLQLKSSWNLLWTWSRPQIDFSDLFLFQRVNHFLGNKQLARKDLLKKNIEQIQKLGARMKQLFDIIPQTYLLPGQNMAFIRKFRECSLKDPLNYWILKPVGMSRGRGIELVKDLQDVVFSEPVVLQKYLSNPLLVDGFKFDMRIYVLVTSMNPLEAYIYREGFARMSTQRYSLKEQDLVNKLIHLTNFSVQRDNVRQDSKSLEQELGGCKISLKMLAGKLGAAWPGIQQQIEQIVIKSLVACMNSIPTNPNCFEVFGYDIIVDDKLKCWLLEVNSSPSLEKEYLLDEVVKQQMIDDALQLLDPIPYDRGRLLQVVQRRRKEAEGLKSAISTTSNSPLQLDMDLDYILNSRPLPVAGQVKTHPNFITAAPSPTYAHIVKQLQHYKINPIVRQQ